MDSNGTSSAVPNGHTTTTTTSRSVPEHHRLCVLVKRENFSGYGFHLHAEKGKPGQFIGKVDPESPAEDAGLRQGDRIIEVNHVAINLESHKEVVERIKALEQEVSLLVLDASQDPTGMALAKKESSATSNGNKKNGSALKIDESSSPKKATGDELSNDLQLTVAEMRAKLANKKKVDPKRESVDIKKKYEMVQAL